MLQSATCNDNVNEEVFLVSVVIGCCYAICYLMIGSVINIVGARKLLSGFIVITTISGVCAQLLSSYIYVQVTLGKEYFEHLLLFPYFHYLFLQ